MSAPTTTETVGTDPKVQMQYEQDKEKHRALCLLTLLDLSDAMAKIVRASLMSEAGIRAPVLAQACAQIEGIARRLRERMLPPHEAPPTTTAG